MKVSIKNRLSAKEAAIALMYEIMEQVENGFINSSPYVYVKNDDDLCFVEIEFRNDNMKYNRKLVQFFEINEKYDLARIRIIRNHFLDIIRSWGFVGVPKNE